MSHFASADETSREAKGFTQKQLNVFKDIVAKYEYPLSFANSAALLHYPQSQYQWVRPGIMLYGAGYAKRTLHELALKPAMRLESQIQALHWIPKGDCVGYGNHWQAPKDSLIAVVAIGYGDGYPRHAKEGTPVLIHGKKMPLAGRVSMDMITVDVTKIASKVQVGDRVVLWGCDEITVDDIAKCADTIGYELLCGVTRRVPMIEL